VGASELDCFSTVLYFGFFTVSDDNVDVVPLGVTDDGWMDAVDVKDVDVVVDFSSGAAGS